MSQPRDSNDARWAAKREWHENERQLPLRAKVAKVIELQHRQQTINQTKAALGLPPVPMRIWKTKP